jgi:hypothetical protein
LREPGKRRRAHAFDIAAEGRAQQVELKDVVLGEVALERESQHDLPPLRCKTAGGALHRQTCRLHRQRRGARHDPPGQERLDAGAKDGARIDPCMRVKPSVLIGQQHADVERIHIVQ